MVLLVSGFLVRHDGALISIDDIIYALMEPQIHVAPTCILTCQYRVMIYLREHHRVQWNKNLLREEEAQALLCELRDLIKKAIEL